MSLRALLIVCIVAATANAKPKARVKAPAVKSPAAKEKLRPALSEGILA